MQLLEVPNFTCDVESFSTEADVVFGDIVITSGKVEDLRPIIALFKVVLKVDFSGLMVSLDYILNLALKNRNLQGLLDVVALIAIRVLHGSGGHPDELALAELEVVVVTEKEIGLVN